MALPQRGWGGDFPHQPRSGRFFFGGGLLCKRDSWLLSRLKTAPTEHRIIKREVRLIDNRTILPDNKAMKGSELIRRVQRYAKENNFECRVDEKRGKGSHVTLYLGEKLTIVRNPKDELKTGTFNAMLKQLGLTLSDL